jgi:hypothetical protein
MCRRGLFVFVLALAATGGEARVFGAPSSHRGECQNTFVHRAGSSSGAGARGPADAGAAHQPAQQARADWQGLPFEPPRSRSAVRPTRRDDVNDHEAADCTGAFVAGACSCM